MKQVLKKYQAIILGTIAGLTVALTMVLHSPTKNQPLPSHDLSLPSPFGDGDMQNALQGAVTRIGTKNNFPVDNITYEAGEISEPLSVDTIQFVLTPGFGISSGAPLKAAITSGKRVFGYKYTLGAQTEIDRRLIPGSTNNPWTFAQRFPGQFFTSDEQRADGYIAEFEAANFVTFLPLSDVALTTNARYVIITNDTGTAFQVRNLMWCGNGLTEGTETCDDGDTESGDGCSNMCAIEPGYTCTGQPSSCTRNGGNSICGNGDIEVGETCDDGDTDSGDGCSNVCAIESGYSCSGEPSVCTPNASCGNGIIEPGEECDDGNLIDNDSCGNDCKILVTPIPS